MHFAWISIGAGLGSGWYQQCLACSDTSSNGGGNQSVAFKHDEKSRTGSNTEAMKEWIKP